MNPQTTYASTVNSFYLAFYGRPADPAGLAFWAEQLANNDGNLSAITQAFATSEEAQVRFGTDTVTERISEIYQALFNRAPDTVGLTYWTNVVAQGNASMADVSVAIMNGAQGIDKSLTALRQTAVDAFTAQVEASGSQYSGYASVEAARILVRAITVDTATGDVDTLVKAAVSFADTATRTPSVVDAIATGTTLLALFDTARGKGDPVALAQALADTAKAAAGNPVTLESLLRGGGMDQVLKVMPANATLKDVVAALAAGGLPAAIEVVYPTAPVVTAPTPAFSLKLAFDHVTQGELDQLDDNVTNQDAADVTFSYTGRDLRADQHFEYSLDGTHWITTDIVVDPVANTVVLKDIQLAPQYTFTSTDSSVNVPVLPTVQLVPPTTSTTTISLRAVDAGGARTTPVTQTIVYDGYVATPIAVLAEDSQHGQLGSDVDLVTNNGELLVLNLEDGATVDYQVQQPLGRSGGVSINGIGPTPVWTTTPVYQEGPNLVLVRVTDAAGNQSTQTVVFVLDTETPETPAIALHSAANNGVTDSGQIDISGLDVDNDTAWEYSLNDGKSWIYGDTNDGSGKGSIALSDAGDYSVQVRQYDLAGNVSEETAALDFTLEIASTLTVFAGSKGLSLQSSVAGDIFLGGNAVESTETDGNAIAGIVSIGAQDSIVSGTFTIVPQTGTTLIDAGKVAYTLGTVDDDFIEDSAFAFGFGGDDSIFGTDADDQLYGGDGTDSLIGEDGNDVLDGGADNDMIYGGVGGDDILVSAGMDSLYYAAPADSNLSVDMGRSFDMVMAGPNALVKFDFKENVTQLYSHTIDDQDDQSLEALLVEMNMYFNVSGASGNDAVLFTIEEGKLLVVNNGDSVIDSNDYAILIAGTGFAYLDSLGNIMFGMPD